MHIVTTTSQVINAIPRSPVLTVTLRLRDEQTREVTSKEITGSLNGNFVQYDLDFTCTEGNFYTFSLFEGSNLLYRSMCFCTNETNLDAYKITEGEYVSQTSNNDYIFNE